MNADLGRGLHVNSEGIPEFEDEPLDLTCQWLAWKGIIRQVAMPVKLTTKSQVPVEEPAYYYDGSVGASGASRGHQQADIHAQIHQALDSLTETLEADMYILAAILTSNLAEDNVWEKTTPYITLILRDGTKFKRKEYQLIEDGIPFRVQLYTRGAIESCWMAHYKGVHSIQCSPKAASFFPKIVSFL